jgi:hypothetical protein
VSGTCWTRRVFRHCGELALREERELDRWNHQQVASVRRVAMFTPLSAYDLLFVLTAIAFNLLIVGIFVAQKHGRARTVQVVGVLWLLLTIPLAVVFVHYLTEGKEPGIMIRFGLVFLYMLVEFLLDNVFRFDFRQKWITHAPYIVLEYVALFSLIGIAADIGRTWGYLVGISTWILIASLIYVYWDKIRPKRK